MVLRLWPDTLPAPSLDGYRLTPVDQVARTDMEAGERRARRITSARRETVTLPFRLTDSEFVAFQAFFADTPWSLAGDSDDLSLWTRTGANLTADSIAGPDAGSLADRIVEDASTGSHYANLLMSTIPQGDTIVARATFRAAGRSWARLTFRDWANTLCRTNIDLTTGALGTQANLISRAVEDRGGGWWRVTIEAGTGTGATTPLIRAQLQTDDATPSYTGSGSSGVDVCEVNARLKTGHDLFVRTGADGKALGGAGGAAWVLMPIARGGGIETAEVRFVRPYEARVLPGLSWEVRAEAEVRDA